MRTLRLFLAAGITLASLGGASVAAAQTDAGEMSQAPTAFEGKLSCTDEPFIREGTTVPVALGRFDDGSLFRYETRGSVMRMAVDEMSDPRFAGTWSGIGNSDQYLYSTSPEPLFGFARVLMRMEDDEGAWQVTGDEPYLPSVPQPEWAMAVMTGEGAYEGLTALLANRFQEDPCGWAVQGLVFEGEPPPMPEWWEPSAE